MHLWVYLLLHISRSGITPVAFWRIRLQSTKHHPIGSKVERHSTFDTAFNNIFNAIGDISDRTCCHKVLVYLANKFLRFVLS